MKLRTFFLALLTLTLLGGRLTSAPSAPGPAPAAGASLFGQTNLWTIHLTVTPKAWRELGAKSNNRTQGGYSRGGGGGNGGFFDSLFGNNNNNNSGRSMGMGIRPGHSAEEYPWAECTVEMAGQVFTNVAIRFKGNSSFVRAPNSLKRPFRLDFNRDHAGRSVLGTEEIVLNNNVNDATQMHEALAYDLFRQAGIAAPRTAFASVTLTIPGQVERQALGLYTLVEPVNHDFLKRAFGTKAGLLVKPEMMPGLAYFGEDWSNYVGRYGPKGKVDPKDTEQMIRFARFIEQADPAEFGQRIGEFIDPTACLRFIALNSILANVDSFIGNGHNYYLFIDSKTHKARFIPWDLNESFGGHPVSGPSSEQMQFSVLRPNADPNMLVERLLSDPKYSREYRAQCEFLMTNVFVPKQLATQIQQIAAVTRRVVEGESKRAKADFQRTVLATLAPDAGDTSVPRHDFEIGQNSYSPWGFPDAVVIDNIPIKEWIRGRHAHVRGQLDGTVRGRRPRARIN